MMCFLLHNLSVAETLLRILGAIGNEWFPITVGYSIVRTTFETDVTAHYITKAPTEHARQYIDFGAVLNKRRMDACKTHRNSKNPQWREVMNLVWQHELSPSENDVLRRFAAVAPRFTHKNKDRKKTLFQNWTGKSLRQMAIEVDHIEAYDIFYAELSSLTHVDVHLADRFLRFRPEGPVWSQQAREFDVGNVFRYAAEFLTCYLKLFGEQFKTWTNTEVLDCWSVRTT